MSPLRVKRGALVTTASVGNVLRFHSFRNTKRHFEALSRTATSTGSEVVVVGNPKTTGCITFERFSSTGGEKNLKLEMDVVYAENKYRDILIYRFFSGMFTQSKKEKKTCT